MLTLTFGIKEVVEDIIENGSLSRDDINELRLIVDECCDYDMLVELMSIADQLDWKRIDKELGLLIANCIIRLYAENNVISDTDAKEIIALFDPEEKLNPINRVALEKIKKLKHGVVLRNFLDDNMI